MESRKRNRGVKLREILAKITPEQHASTYKQMAIAARIADALKDKGWSKGEFATKMNQQPSVITRWLSGTQNFTIDTLSDIEDALGVQLLTIAELKPPMRKDKAEKYFIAIFVRADSALSACRPLSVPHFQTGLSTYITDLPVVFS